LAKIALKAHALRNPEARDDAPLDLLPGLAGSLANCAIFLARSVEVSREFVVLAGL
jgi:hypothetical protein